MLDHDYQVPLSSPYPGLLDYYGPFNEPLSSAKPKEDYLRLNPDIPSWAFDEGGYCWVKKDLTVGSNEIGNL